MLIHEGERVVQGFTVPLKKKTLRGRRAREKERGRKRERERARGRKKENQLHPLTWRVE